MQYADDEPQELQRANNTASHSDGQLQLSSPLFSQYMDLIRQGIFKSYECNYVMSSHCFNKAIQLLPTHFRAYFHKANDLINSRKLKKGTHVVFLFFETNTIFSHIT